MSNDISLTASQRRSLLSLQETQALSGRTQNRLSSGRKVNSVIDNAVSFFASRALNSHAERFEERKEGIGQALNHLQVTVDALDGVENFLKQMKGLLTGLASNITNNAALVAGSDTIDTLGTQIRRLADDATYQGVNLINSSTAQIAVDFGIVSDSRLVVSGGGNLYASAAAAGGAFTVAGVFGANGSFVGSALVAVAGGLSAVTAANASLITEAIGFIDAAIGRIQGRATNLGVSASILQVREEFTKDYVNSLKGGADKLVLADLNEEGANLAALQTRQQLGIQAIAIAGQEQQAVLNLIR